MTEFNWEIGLIFVLLVATLVSFAWEKISSDLTALTLFAILLVTGLLPSDRALSVFSNPAPLTVGAMFILSAAMEKCGLITRLAASLEPLTKLGHAGFLLVLMLVVAFISAFINNTPVVVVFLPVVLSLARKMDIPASKLLIPLSFASIFGGTCTLVGTSTNILVSTLAVNQGEPAFSMFELSKVGVPMLLVGVLYLVLFSRWLLPKRETISSILSEEERQEYITQAFVKRDSELVGKTLQEAGLAKAKGVRVIEIVRRGASLRMGLDKIKLQIGDRIVLASRPSGIAQARSLEGVNLMAERGLALEEIESHEGMLVEGVVGANSYLLGKTLREINFRQRYRMLVVAVHRKGRNLREQLETQTFQFGDTLLMMGSENAIDNLRNDGELSRDIMLLDRPSTPSQSLGHKIPIVLLTIVGVIGTATLGIAPIQISAFVGCVVLFLTGCLKPIEGYGAIQWNILFLIFSMLAMGMAMEQTGTARFIAERLVQGVDYIASDPMKPMLMLVGLYLLTTFLTEILSNNAAAVLVGVLAFSIADTIGVDVRPFLIAVALAASASFATPIGYQTNTYIYGVGGYRFSDFLKVGLPLNALYFVGSVVLIPLFWSF